MQFEYSPYIIPLLVAAVISGWVAVYAWSRRSINGAYSFVIMAGAITIWSLGYVLEIGGADLAAKLLGGKIQYLGISLAPLTWFIFALHHYHPERRLKPAAILALLVIPLVTMALAFTTETHGLVWKEFHLQRTGNFSALQITYGTWFWFNAAYSYLLLLIGAVIVIRSMFVARGLYRGQAAALIIGVLAPWVGNALYLSGNSPIPHLDLTPFAFTITVASLAWGVFGFRLADISPIARELVVEAMSDGMVVLDKKGRIADMNAAAGHIIGMPAGQAIGKPVHEVFSPWPHLLECFRNDSEVTEKMEIGKGEAQRQYEARVASLRDQQGIAVGRVVILRDATGGPVPRPRFAEPMTAVRKRVQPDVQPAPEPKHPARPLGWLTGFFAPPARVNIPVRPGYSLSWTQTMERVFTIMLRIAAVLGTIVVFLTFPAVKSLQAYTVSIVIIASLLWVLGLWRSLHFTQRINAFLLIIYGLALVETFNFGYSVEAFTYFVTLVVLGSLFEGLRGGLWTLAVSLATMGIFGVLIPLGVHRPAGGSLGVIEPVSLNSALVSISAYIACSVALLASLHALMNSLNRAWQKETQALNLLQQERDLLEKRIDERTRDLAKARDQAVKTSNDLRKYFLAIEQSGNTIVITDTKGTIEYANPKFTELTGYTNHEARGQNPRVLKSGAHNDAFYKNMWNTISSGHIWQGEFHNKRKDGSLFWESATIAPVISDDGTISNYIAIKEDITAQKELQEKLSEQNQALQQEVAARQRTALLLMESEARFRQIVENASDIIYRTDVQGRFTYVNPTALKLMNFKNEKDVIGKHYLELAAPYARNRLKRFYTRQLLARQETSYFEFPAVTQDGIEIWLGQNVQLINENDAVIGFQAVARDITAIKKAQEAIAISRDQALEASRLKGQLLSRVSHELRTPLGAILGYAELMKMDAFGTLNADQKEAATQIMASTIYLNQIVSELLDEAQIESKTMTLNMDFFSPAAMLESVQSSMSVLAQNKGLAFSAKTAPGLPEALFGDERRLQQVLINLVGNAIKYTRTGGVKVYLYQPSPSHWAMEVEDTGVGIPEEAQAYIFDPFRQVDNSITHENRGTGLGLSITKQLVELMDGEISLQSVVGKGSTFTVILPILKKQEHSE